MPFGDSALERISQNVLATLVTIAPPIFPITLSVSRGKKLQSPQHLTAQLWQLSPDEVTDQVVAADEWEQHYALVAYVQPTEADATPIDVYNNQISSAVHYVLLQDVTRGGLALNTTIKPTLYFPPIEGDAAGITIAFTVLYRTALNDPYTPLA